jgi:hypothetical protein
MPLKSKSKKSVGSDEVLRLVLVSVDPTTGFRTRERDYAQHNKMLIAIETNEMDAPMGLKRVRRSDLPRLGGILSTIVLATDVESGRQKLVELWTDRAKRLEKDMKEVQSNLLLLRLNQK